MSVDELIDWVRAASCGAPVSGCDSHLVKHGLRKLASGFMDLPVQASQKSIRWCFGEGFKGSRQAASARGTQAATGRSSNATMTSPVAGAAAATTPRDFIKLSGPLLYMRETELLPSTYRLSVLAIAASHPCQSPTTAVTPQIEVDPGCTVAGVAAAAAPTTPAAATGLASARDDPFQGLTSSLVASPGVDGSALLRQGLSVDGVGVALRCSDLLPGLGPVEVGCIGGSRQASVDATAIRAIAPGNADGDRLTGGRLRPVYQTVLSLLTSHGIPAVDDAMRAIVLARHVRVTLIDKIAAPKADGYVPPPLSV